MSATTAFTKTAIAKSAVEFQPANQSWRHTYAPDAPSAAPKIANRIARTTRRSQPSDRSVRMKAERSGGGGFERAMPEHCNKRRKAGPGRGTFLPWRPATERDRSAAGRRGGSAAGNGRELGEQSVDLLVAPDRD